MTSDSETERELVVHARQIVADGVVALELRDPLGGELPPWSPGAHVDLRLAGDLVRQYSLCGDPGERSAWRLAIQLEAHGRGGSRHVHERLDEGSRVQVCGPRNRFVLESAERYLFLAGGIGITPLLPMIAHVAGAGASWKLVYGGRNRPSMAFVRHLVDAYPGAVTVHPQDTSGLLPVDELVDGVQRGSQIYCCGPEGLLDAIEARCAGRSDVGLHVERFAPRATVPGFDSPAFSVTVASTGQTYAIPEGSSVLEVLRDNEVPVGWSCEEGTCGSCITPVLEGDVKHRDSVLSLEEQQEMGLMALCVSRAQSCHLLLDL